MQSDLKDRTGWANEIAGQMQEADKTIVKLQSDFEDRTNWALRLNNELEECHQRLESIEKSKLYKLAKTLRLIKFD